MAEQEQEQRPDVRRRSSFGRALERVRDALKRRRSSAAAVATLQSTREEGATTASPLAAEELETATIRKDGNRTETRPSGLRESISDSQLEADDLVADVPDENEEPLTPAFSSRMGINEDKAKALFERYGIKYTPRHTASDPTQSSKIRRVERPVRIRIHWTCHECKRQFGHDRACVTCGHRRCEDCPRAPPKKVKAILEEAKQQQQLVVEEKDAANKDQILAAIAPNTVASPVQPSTTSDILDVDDENVDMSQLTMEQRPRSGIKLVMRQKAPAMRRVCHECQTPFGSRNRNKCEGCGHDRCDACPSRTVKPSDEPPFESTMVASVQRVYRKPRQRVRWQCDKCDTIFADSRTCRTCSHQRCEDCVRSPVKRPPYQPDPAVLQSLNDKIEAWQRQRSAAAEIITTELEPEVS